MAKKYNFPNDVNNLKTAVVKAISPIAPNGDGTNDKWEIENIRMYSNISIEIYNRWGAIIYQFNGSGTQYASKPWDGTYNNKLLPINSYVYIVIIENDEPRNGIVTIIR